MKHTLLILLLLVLTLNVLGQTSTEKLWQAVKDNNLAEAKQSISEGADVNSKDDKNTPVLWWAIMKGELPLIKHLISEGADYQVKKANLSCGSFCYYGSMLVIAVAENKLDVTKYLVEKLKVEINQNEWNASKKCFCGWSALQWSLNYRHDAVTAYLLEQGANLNNIQGKEKQTNNYRGSLKALENFRQQKYIRYRTIKNALHKPLEVHHLELRQGGYETLPMEDLLKFKNLKILDIRYFPELGNDSYLSDVLYDEEALIEAVEIDFSKKKLSVLPKEIAQLTHLEVIDCAENDISELPEELFQLVNLRRLDVSNNQITVLPSGIGKLQNLQELNFSNNQIKEIPKELTQLKNLQKLYTSENQITMLPSGIGKLQNLQYLHLSNNQLNALPKEIGRLQNLKDLSCSNNQIKRLPKEVGQLVKLQYLLCNDNELIALPKELGQLVNLEYLGFSNNKLTTLPREVGALKKLTYLGCSDNPFQTIPNEIFPFLRNLKFAYSEEIEKLIED